MAHLGTPCWYELTTPDLEGAQSFYSGIVGWTFASAGMPGFDYRLASIGGDMVAGAMRPESPDMPAFWMVYVAVDDGEATVAAIRRAGGTVHKDLAEIPGTGRFAIAADPQGAVFGLLEPLPGGSGGAFDQRKPGHGNWHELMSRDPKAAMAFYAQVFGWTPSRSLDMGAMGSYDIVAHGSTDIGGMMRLMPGMDRSFWLPYFGLDGIDGAVGRIAATGGRVLNGPMEVPGGAWIIQAQDPQGAMVAFVGPR